MCSSAARSDAARAVERMPWNGRDEEAGHALASSSPERADALRRAQRVLEDALALGLFFLTSAATSRSSRLRSMLGRAAGSRVRAARGFRCRCRTAWRRSSRAPVVPRRTGGASRPACRRGSVRARAGTAHACRRSVVQACRPTCMPAISASSDVLSYPSRQNTSTRGHGGIGIDSFGRPCLDYIVHNTRWSSRERETVEFDGLRTRISARVASPPIPAQVEEIAVVRHAVLRRRRVAAVARPQHRSGACPHQRFASRPTSS